MYLCFIILFQGSGFRAAVWDGEALVVPSDNGKVMWWDKDGGKVCEFESCMQDYTVHMDWSVSGNGLWMCGFSCMAYLAIERSDDGKHVCIHVYVRT